MDINVKYYYKQRYLPTSRHRKIRERKLSGEVAVYIKELISSEFPIAFIVHDMKSVCEGMKSYRDYESCKREYRMFSEEIRTYEGRLYKPIRVTHGAAISTIFENEEEIASRLESIGKDFWVSETDNYSEKSIVVDDNSSSVIEAIRGGAKHYLFCDGAFWSTCNEPRYLINTFGLGHNHGGTGFFVEYHYNPNISSKNYFNALQRDLAIAYGKAVAARRGDTESVDRIGIHDNIEVLMPEMVKVQPNKEHGNGNEFMNAMESIVDNSNSVGEAGLACLCAAMAMGKIL